jgi:hypothetical protein
MRQRGNITKTSMSKLTGSKKGASHLQGTAAMFATKPTYGTDAQLGIPYGQKVFNNQNLTPGAADAIEANPPWRFYVQTATGTFPMLLPPENTVGGAAVPPLPDGIIVYWNTSFMGVTIPSDMMGPYSKGGKLTIQPVVTASSGGTGATTDTQLLADNKILLNLLMSVMGALINSYSSYPYANGFGMLSNDILEKRTKADFLLPDASSTVLQTIVNTALKPYEAVGNTVANLVVPGSGTALQAAENTITNPVAAAIAGKPTVSANTVSATETTQVVPPTVSGSLSDLATNIQAGDPGTLFVLAIVAALIIYLIVKK